MKPTAPSSQNQPDACAADQEFAQLLTTVAPRALRAASAVLADWQEAEDAVQEAAIVAFRSFGRLRDRQAFGAWFVRIAVNKAIDLLRSRRREQARLMGLSEPGLYHNPGAGPGDLEAAMDLADAVDQLPATHRVVVRLYYTSQYTTPEIAQLLDRPEGTVRRMLSEAYKTLRALLASAAYASTTRSKTLLRTNVPEGVPASPKPA